ncbi:MAG: DUF488 family protein [Chromatiaceae bacterium]|nr:DUF488 family protein [Chromatiaceae bacterium]
MRSPQIPRPPFHRRRRRRYDHPHRQTWQPTPGRRRPTHRGRPASPARRTQGRVASRDIYDVRFPNLAPSEALLKATNPRDERSWKTFRRRFQAEMNAPTARRDLDLLAALSHQTNLALGCYCEEEARCHRSILRELLERRGAELI